LALSLISTDQEGLFASSKSLRDEIDCRESRTFKFTLDQLVRYVHFSNLKQ